MALKQHGIGYLYLGDALGGQPKDPDCYADGKVLYDRVKEKTFFKEGIARLRRAFEQGRRVAIMCSEGKPELCHRSVLIGAALTELGVPVSTSTRTMPWPTRTRSSPGAPAVSSACWMTRNSARANATPQGPGIPGLTHR